MATGALDGPAPEPGERGQRALALLDKAIAAQSPLVRKNIARARQRNAEATPAQAIRSLERMYVSALTGTGAAVGGTAAAPGVGTGVALALSAGEALSSLELTALYALSIAEVHGVPIDEIERAEWPTPAGAIATRYEFADTGEALAVSRDVPADGSAPAHQFQIRP